EPPEMQALAHHGVDSAVELVLFIAIFAGAIAEMLPGGHTVPVAGNSDRDQDAADRAREAGLVKHGAYFLLHELRVAQPTGMENVKVDDDVMVGGHFCDHGKECARRVRELGILSVRGEDMNALSLVIVFSGRIALPFHREGAKVGELSNAVVPPSEGLQNQL